jgi:hypothetical protein
MLLPQPSRLHLVLAGSRAFTPPVRVSNNPFLQEIMTVSKENPKQKIGLVLALDVSVTYEAYSPDGTVTIKTTSEHMTSTQGLSLDEVTRARAVLDGLENGCFPPKCEKGACKA